MVTSWGLKRRIPDSGTGGKSAGIPFETALRASSRVNGIGPYKLSPGEGHTTLRAS